MVVNRKVSVYMNIKPLFRPLVRTAIGYCAEKSNSHAHMNWATFYSSMFS